jgi:hypothetical protein
MYLIVFAALLFSCGKMVGPSPDSDSDSDLLPSPTMAPDLITVGYEINDSHRMVAKVWRGNSLLYDLSDGARDAEALAVFITSKGSIYVAGDEFNEDNTYRVATIWKDGKVLSRFPEGDINSTACDIWVSEDDDGEYFYAAGFKDSQTDSDTTVAELYYDADADGRLDVLTNLSTGLGGTEFKFSKATSLVVDGDFAFIAGYEFETDNDAGDNGFVTESSGIWEAKIWKVNVITGERIWNKNSGGVTLGLPSYNSRAYSVAKDSGGVLYVAGYQENGFETAKPVLWRVPDTEGNDTPSVIAENIASTHYSHNAGKYIPSAEEAVTVGPDGEVYTVAGESPDESEDTMILKVRKREKVIATLTDGRFQANALAVVVDGDGHTYVAGDENNRQGNSVAKVWKDSGQPINLTRGSRIGSARDLAMMP